MPRIRGTEIYLKQLREITRNKELERQLETQWQLLNSPNVYTRAETNIQDATERRKINI